MTTRHRNIAIGVLAALLLARVALPYALEWAIESFGTDAVGAPVAVEDVDLSVLAGGVALEGLTVDGVDESRLLSLDRLHANLQWTSLFRGEVHLAELRLDAPAIAFDVDEYGAPRLPEPVTEEAGDPVAEPVEAPSVENASEEPAPGAGAEEPAPAEDEGAEDPGWPVLIDQLVVTGADLRVTDPSLEGTDPAVDFGFGAFELAAIRMEGGRFGLGGVGLSEPRLEIRRDFVTAERPTPPAEEDDAPGEAQAHRVERLGIDRAEFTLLTDGGPLEVALAFEATELSTAAGATFPLRIDLEIEGGTLGIEGTVGVEPPTFAGALRWASLPVPKLALAADPRLSGWLRSASASGNLDLEFGPATNDALIVSGTTQLDGFDFASPDGEEVTLTWESLAVELARSTLPTAGGAPEIDVASVTWKAPKGRYTVPAPALEALLAGEESAAEPSEEADVASSPPSDPARVRIRDVSVTGGNVRFVDRSVSPAFDGRFTRLAVSARDVRIPENRSQKVRITGRGPGGAAFSLDGTPAPGGRVLFELERLGLAQFDPYATGAIGYRTQGEATIKTEIELGKERVDVGNKLVLHGIGLDSTGEAILDEIIGMPVDLALALLRDLQGDIKLGVPVAVERGNVSVSVGTIVRDALRAAIAGAVMAPLKIANTAASPLKALGGMLAKGNSNGLSIPALESVPGGTALLDGQEERIDSMVGFLEMRPQLALVLHGRSDESDRDGLARRMLIEAVEKGDDLPEIDGAGFFERRRVRGALAKMGKGETPELGEKEAELLAAYEAATFVTPDRYDALARERAEALKRELVEAHQVDAARLTVAAEPERAEPGVRAALGVLSGV